MSDPTTGAQPRGRVSRWIHSNGQYFGLIVVGLLWAGTLAALVLWGLSVQHTASANAASATSTCKTGRIPISAVPARVKPLTATSADVSFGRTLGHTTRRFEYDVRRLPHDEQRPRCVRVQVGPFVRASGDFELDKQLITTHTHLSGNRLVVDVQFDRSSASLTQAGLYAGTVSIVDPRLQRVDIPITVGMSYPIWQFPVALFVALLLPEFTYVWLLKGSFQSGDARFGQLTLKEFASYLFDRNGLIAVATGTVAAFGILSATYFAATAWDGDFLRYAALTGAMFSAFVAAATAVAAAGADKTHDGRSRRDAAGR